MHLGSYDIKFCILFAFVGWFAVGPKFLSNLCVRILAVVGDN
jgi:hypothetical protein